YSKPDSHINQLCLHAVCTGERGKGRHLCRVPALYEHAAAPSRRTRKAIGRRWLGTAPARSWRPPPSAGASSSSTPARARGSCAGGGWGSCPRGGCRGGGPAGDDHVGVVEQAEGTLAAAEGGVLVRAEQELDAVAVGHDESLHDREWRVTSRKRLGSVSQF